MNVGNFFKKTLPHLALAVASGVPGPVGAVAQIINSVIPPSPGSQPVPPDPAAINKAVESATPEQLAALQPADQQFAVQMKQLGVQEESDWLSFIQQDTASARAREVSIKDWTPRVLGSGVVSAFVVSVFLILSGHAKADSVLAGTLVGYLSAKSELVLSYYFGSSAGSDRKTEILAQNK